MCALKLLFFSHTLRDTGFTNFSLYAELNKPGAIYAYAATQQNAPNITLGIGWPPAVEVRSLTHSATCTRPSMQAAHTQASLLLGLPGFKTILTQTCISCFPLRTLLGLALMSRFKSSHSYRVCSHLQGPLAGTQYCETGPSSTACTLIFASGITSNTNYVVNLLARDIYANVQQVGGGGWEEGGADCVGGFCSWVVGGCRWVVGCLLDRINPDLWKKS